jgi:hypothetical protein
MANFSYSLPNLGEYSTRHTTTSSRPPPANTYGSLRLPAIVEHRSTALNQFIIPPSKNEQRPSANHEGGAVIPRKQRQNAQTRNTERQARIKELEDENRSLLKKEEKLVREVKFYKAEFKRLNSIIKGENSDHT